MSFTVEELRRQVSAIEIGLAENTLATKRIEKNVNGIEGRLDRMDLNGRTVALRNLADAAPALQELADSAPALVLIANSKEDVIALAIKRYERRTFWRLLKGRVGWDKGTRIVLQLLVGSVFAATATAIIGKLANIQWHLP